MSIPVIAIFDIGKTNKKLFLFDQEYKIGFERSVQFPEIVDEDGDNCDDLKSLTAFVLDTFQEVLTRHDFDIKAINFSGYGASLVYLDEQLRTFTPLYNYLKPYPDSLKKQFYDTYGGEEEFSFRMASPVLGNLNSGMQLYLSKYEKPEIFRKIKYALHLPQYLSFLITGQTYSDMTSIGCHTNLWDFQKNEYSAWVREEGVLQKLAPIVPSDEVIPISFSGGKNLLSGVGLHDSSAALIPYLAKFSEPFVLLSTGTWCISMNPFNHVPLTKKELENDCLCYMSFEGKPVKASRLFAGYEHEQEVRRISDYFHQPIDRYRSMKFDPGIIMRLMDRDGRKKIRQDEGLNLRLFSSRPLSDFADDAEAYHQLMLDIITQQVISTEFVLKDVRVSRIFVDGGFSQNAVYMNLLASVFPDIEVYAASIAQASAIGAALAIHESWNEEAIPDDLIQLVRYQAGDVLSEYGI